MSKYLIKPISSIFLTPQKVYDLKRDLLLFDKAGMLNVYILLNSLHAQREKKEFRNALNEVEFLIKKDLFIELTHLMQGMKTAVLDEYDQELAAFTMELQRQQAETAPDDHEKRASLYWQHDELNTRLMCRITNSNTDSVYTVPSFSNFSNFELKSTVKETGYKIVHRLLPMPSDETPWEKIFDFRNDEESKAKLYALRNWINELPSDSKKDEVEDRIKYLVNQYSLSLKKHRISSKVSTIRTIVTAVPKALSEIIRLKLDSAIDAFFSIAEQNVNFEKFKQESELQGHELAYISHVNEYINRRK